MQHFKKFLAAIAPEVQEQPALRRAVQVAQHNHAELDILAVMEETPPCVGRLMQRLQVDATLEAIKQELIKRLENHVASLHAAGLKVNIDVATGTLFLEIIRTVIRHRHCLILTIKSPGFVSPGS